MTVGWRMAEAAADLCASVARPGLGWNLHALSQYRAGLRPAARRVFGLEPGRLGVLAVARDGPADQAGIRADDLVLSVGDALLDVDEGGQALTQAGDFAQVERALSQVEMAVADAPVAVRLARRGEILVVTVQPRRHCPWPVQVIPSDDFAATADGRHISITSRLSTFAESDDDLAFLLGHEMGHNLRRPDRPDHRTRSIARELEADRIGLILAARAGYDTAKVPEFVELLARRAAPISALLRFVPGSVSRIRLLRQTEAWIQAERLAGRPLTP